MLNYSKKRDQKKQNIKLRTVSDAEMEGMHSCFRTIVKQIGGLVNIESNQFSLQKYIRSSVIQKRRILEEE